jgi:hypothetical protein
LSASCKCAAVIAVFEPVPSHCERSDEPEEKVDEIDPDGILHALDARVAFGVFLDVHLLGQVISKGAFASGMERQELELTLPKMPKSTIHMKSRRESQAKMNGIFIVKGIM